MLKIISLVLLIILLFVINFKDKTIVNKKNLMKTYDKYPKTTKQLEEICKIMTNKKYIKLKNIKKSCKYISVTIPFKIRLEINFIINAILRRINELFNYKTYFIEVDHLEVFEDNIGNKQYIANVLVNNIINSAGIKLKIDIIAYIKNKEKLNNYLNKFKIGIPSNDQLIPIPMDVLVNERGFISSNSINETKPDKFSHLYINYIKILNANCIMNGDHIDNKELEEQIQKNMGGVNNTQNEFSYISNCNCNPYIEPAIIRNKWPTLKDEPTDRKQWPCTPALLTWNELGVPFHKLHYTKDCPGKRESTVQTELQAQTYPTLGPLPRDKGQNIWLFDQARGIPSFPTGRSTG
tara:strand:- start:1016 stop:2068 length:1053 start_codon:yes stop_codon:yes gene_type:complete